MQGQKLISKNKLRKATGIDTIASSRSETKGGKCLTLLSKAQQYWQNLDQFRRDRNRNKRYTYGDQWGDMVIVDGKWMTEENYIKKQGSIPLKNNLIRRLVRSVLGVYRNQSKEPTCTARDRDEQQLSEVMSTVLQYNWQLNRMNEINARSMEEFLIGGMIIHKKSYGWRNDKLDCWTDYVNPNNFFIDDSMKDFRGWDCTTIGEIHDVTFGEVCREFARRPEDYTKLAQIYQNAQDRLYVASTVRQFGSSDIESLDFFVPEDLTLCRVIEVWTKELKPRIRCHDYLNGEVYKIEIEEYNELVEKENTRRKEDGRIVGLSEADIPLIETEWFVDDYWYCRYLSPFGDVLKEGETPFAHKSHPYVFKAYPYIDGEIHSFVADIIDQQRYVNRLITLNDFIMRSSAKGVLLFPEECLPEGMSVEDVADEWSRFDGLLLVKTKNATMLPKQIANNSTNIGIGEILNLQLKFFEDITGVSGALQGKPGFNGQSATLYNQQTQNATISILDLLDSFGGFIVDSAYKDVKNIQQYYTSKRYFNISGNVGQSIEYDPRRIGDVEFDMSVAESASTPAYRMLANDFLLQIWSAGQISLEQLLEHGNFPFADSLLQSIQAQKEQIAQGQIPQNFPPEIQQQMQQGANMEAVNQLNQALKR